MPPPSPLAIATSSINRLLKEESSYRTELSTQQQRLPNLEADTTDYDEGNKAFQIDQEVPSVLIQNSPKPCPDMIGM